MDGETRDPGQRLRGLHHPGAEEQAYFQEGPGFFKLGYQAYKFDYTGSNNWIGAPKKISDLATSPANAQMLAPVEKATDIYLTFEVRF